MQSCCVLLCACSKRVRDRKFDCLALESFARPSPSPSPRWCLALVRPLFDCEGCMEPCREHCTVHTSSLDLSRAVKGRGNKRMGCTLLLPHKTVPSHRNPPNQLAARTSVLIAFSRLPSSPPSMYVCPEREKSAATSADRSSDVEVRTGQINSRGTFACGCRRAGWTV